MAEISICIPTYNRADLLDETLAHLASLRDISMEVVLTDNASPDHTKEVAKKYQHQFSRFFYHRQPRNLGAFLNQQSAFSYATSPLTYFFSDDDRLNPEAIKKIIAFLGKNPKVVAVFGNHCEFNPDTGEEYAVAKNIQQDAIFESKDKVKMLESFSVLWSPITRTEIRQRHCFCDDTTLGFWRDVEQLLKHGSIAVICDMVYKHAQTFPRMEQRMIEPWYHDQHRSDFELFFAGLGVDNLAEGTDEYIKEFLHSRTVGLHMMAFNFSCEHEKYLLQRHYLLRARCHGKVTDEQLKEWEQLFILHCVLERIEVLLNGLPDVQKIILETSPILGYLLQIKSQERFSGVPDMELCPLESLLQRKTNDNEMILVMDYETLQDKKIKKQGYEFALNDMLNTLRVTKGNLEIKTG